MSKTWNRLRPTDESAHNGVPGRKETDMKYILLIYTNKATMESFSRDDMNGIFTEVDEIMKELIASGEWVGGEGLADITTTKTIKVRDGVPAVTDGPYVEAKEYLAGYCLLECETEARALEIAKRWPDARYTAVEIRALMSDAGLEM
jgi:hypothetical protein